MFTAVIKVLNNLIERLTSKQLIACTAAIGVLIALLVYLTLTHIESNFEKEAELEKSKPVEMTKAVVAKVDIPRGVVINADMLTVKKFAVESLPKGTSSDVEDFINLPTKLEIFAGDILTAEKVFTDYRQAGFVGMIPENCRAVAVSVDNVSGMAGLLKAGDRVDVILLLNSEGGKHSTVLLQNVLLLSINRNVNRYIQTPKEKKSGKDKTDDKDTANDKSELSTSSDEEKTEDEDAKDEDTKKGKKQSNSPPVIPSSGEVGTVTLALKPDEVTRIIAATTIGKIYLVLRPLKPRGDSMFINETDYYTATDSSELPQPKIAMPQPPNAPLPVIPAAPPVGTVPSPALPAIPNNGVNPTPQTGAFEVIPWGN